MLIVFPNPKFFSLQSFKNAIDNQYGIECDVVLSSDGEVMVYHDYDLNRLCGIDKKISETTKLELKSLKLLNSESGILTLDEDSVELFVEMR